MQPTLTHCGYVITGDSIHPMAAKVNAIKHPPEPKNVGQLCAFLGMFTYYYRFLPDVATVLEPLR